MLISETEMFTTDQLIEALIEAKRQSKLGGLAVVHYNTEVARNSSYLADAPISKLELFNDEYGGYVTLS